MNALSVLAGDRPGHTLAELLVAMVGASVLMVGLSSTIYIATQGTSSASTSTAILDGNAAILEMLREMQFALSFSERTTNAITFTVPDRDGDSNPETIRYAWSGIPGDPLTRQYNGGATGIAVEDVHVFQHDLPPLNSNLLSNADLEAGTVNWQAFPDSGISSSNEQHTGAKALYHLRWPSSGESGARQDVTMQITNGATYEVGHWLQTWTAPGGVAKVQLRVSTSGGGEQVFAGQDHSVYNTDWNAISGTVTPTWSGTLLFAYWEAVSDLQEVTLDDTYMRLKQDFDQNVNLRLQVGAEASALIQSGTQLFNAPL